MWLDGLLVNCFWFFACFLKVWLVTMVALESLNFGANLLPKSSKKSTKSDQGCPRASQNRSKGRPLRGSEKQVANKCATGRNSQATGSKMGIKVWRILGDMFRWFFASFCWWFLNRFVDHFGIYFCIILMICLDLCKCTRRSHGSMVFKVSAPCILMIVHDFICIPHLNVRFPLGSILEAILARFKFYFGSFGGSKSDQNVIKN